jgi:hypothetical protein
VCETISSNKLYLKKAVSSLEQLFYLPSLDAFIVITTGRDSIFTLFDCLEIKNTTP